MNRLFLSLVLILGALGPASAASELAALPSGTLIFLENVSSVVELTTRGEIGHVAMVIRTSDETWVYEATPGKVRRLLISDYYAELARLNKRRDEDERVRVFTLRPNRDYTDGERSKMQVYLDAQLGRRYSVKNYVRGQPYDGIHCAELASSTLNQSGRYAFQDCHKIHPQALYAAVLPTHSAAQELVIPPLAAKDSWTTRAKRRCSGWWTWCGWSCREAWLFCW